MHFFLSILIKIYQNAVGKIYPSITDEKFIVLLHSFQVYKTPTTKYVTQQPVVPDT